MARAVFGSGAIAVCLATALAGCSLQQGIAQGSGSQGQPVVSAPAINSATLDGGTFSWESTRGRPVVLDFWASWCGPCRAEQHELDAIAARYGNRVLFLGVDMRDDTAAANAYRNDYGVTYPSVADPAEQISAAYDVAAPPTVIVVDAHGRIVDRLLGTLTGLRTRLEGLT
jgi:thiol-disulfide isomerase/thioredoxin